MDEQWLPVFVETIKWVKEKMRPTKKELQLKISDLEEQVKILSYGNQSLSNNIEQIMTIIISQLKSDEHYIINADTIIHITGNNGKVNVIKSNKINNICRNEDEQFYESIFNNMDEEIKQCRLTRPSEREEKK